MEKLTLADFNYDLPDQLIAQEPLSERSGSRLLVRSAAGDLQDRNFAELPNLLVPGTHLVFNDTRVIPGRLMAQTIHGGRIELMLLKVIDRSQNRWQALGRPFRKLNVGTKLRLDDQCQAKIESQDRDSVQPCIEVSFSLPYEAFLIWMEQAGYIPLPPYIARPDAEPSLQSRDRERYQTIYAREKGSVAAPTAGLHFTPSVWQALEQRGIELVPLTLHVGGGTFLPVKTDDLSQHAMHKEVFRVSTESWQRLLTAAQSQKPIIAVGTTSLRCLESLMRRMANEDPSQLLDSWLETDLFLYPKHRNDRITPWGISGIITNFHQPESSLLMLVSALIGYEAMRGLYQHAISQQYRFLSYGDASLLYLR